MSDDCPEDQCYISATHALAESPGWVLKAAETFAVFDRHGDIQPLGLGEQGIYCEGTRFLNRWELYLGDYRPFLLGSAVKEDNFILIGNLTNPDFHVDERLILPKDTIHIFQSTFLWEDTCYKKYHIKNYGRDMVKLPFTFRYGADFVDIFEVRGLKREKRGRYLPPVVKENCVFLAYEGLDGVLRRVRIDFSFTPRELSDSRAFFEVELDPHEEKVFYVSISCRIGDADGPSVAHDRVLVEADRIREGLGSSFARITTSSDQFNGWLNRSYDDLNMMITRLPTGPYPYAGIPWFSTAFGRDGIIAALECLWLNPNIARGVLAYLASTQAKDADPGRDAEPGKILHETRRGELAALGEIPFGLYYGSVDSTPLFIMLAGAYHERTGDLAFIRKIWPSIEKALAWVDTYGDKDNDGFVEYARCSDKGLVHQGWKDSHDPVFHADGTPAQGPIALCEVQGYVYAAKKAAADLAVHLGRQGLAGTLRDQAERLRQNFNRVFWDEDLGTFVLALDGDKKPCRVRTSNAGHCLYTGIAFSEHARQLAQTLFSEFSFSGWGIRTVSAAESRYNPMSYHNGSVWPHDNALIAMGLARYGFKDMVLSILTGLFQASLFVDLHRLPELFCGFRQRAGEAPTLYPVACSPQAWAAASVFLLVQAALGIAVKGDRNQVHFFLPCLPDFLQEVRLDNLKVGDGMVDLFVQRHGQDAAVNILRRSGNVEIVVVK